MRAIIQRVTEAQLSINNDIHATIPQGLVVLLGIANNDQQEDEDWLLKKISQLRIFSDEEGKMNKSILDIQGALLIVSQFTLFADLKKGNRPGFKRSAPPTEAEAQYLHFVSRAKELLGDEKIKTGIFGADMQIQLVNDGPVTIVLDSQQKDF